MLGHILPNRFREPWWRFRQNMTRQIVHIGNTSPTNCSSIYFDKLHVLGGSRRVIWYRIWSSHLYPLVSNQVCESMKINSFIMSYFLEIVQLKIRVDLMVLGITPPQRVWGQFHYIGIVLSSLTCLMTIQRRPNQRCAIITDLTESTYKGAERVRRRL